MDAHGPNKIKRIAPFPILPISGHGKFKFPGINMNHDFGDEYFHFSICATAKF